MNNKYAALTPDILSIVKNKNTEKPFSGKYGEKKFQGRYLCGGCAGLLLFSLNLTAPHKPQKQAAFIYF